MDVMGDHAISCQHTNHRVAKHNAIVNGIEHLLRDVGQVVAIEESLSSGSVQGRPGDLVIRNWNNGRDLWCDVSVASPLCPSYVELAANVPLATATHRSRDKTRKYRSSFATLQNDQHLDTPFLPLIVENLGGWEEHSAVFLKRLASLYASTKGLPFAVAVCRVFALLSFRLQKHNAFMLADRLSTFGDFSPLSEQAAALELTFEE